MDQVIESLLLSYITAQLEEFTTDDVVAYAKKCLKNSGIPVLRSEIENFLQTNGSVFQMGENTYISRGAVFTNVFFNIKLSAREIAGKYLIHGHRCMPFVRPDISCGRIDFKYKGKLLAHKIVTLPVNEAVDYFFLYGEEYALQIILSDPANENNGMSQEDTSIQNVNLMATDLSPLFEDVTIKKSDYLQGTISNWSLSFVDLYPLVNKKENPFRKNAKDTEREIWFSDFEKALIKSFTEQGPCGSIEEQLALTYFENPHTLYKKYAGSIEEAILRSKIIGIESYGVETRLWKKNQDIPAVGPWMFGQEENIVIPEKSKKTPIRESVPFVLPRIVLDSWITDGLFNKKDNEEEILNFIETDWDITSGIKRREVQGFIRGRRLALEARYNWFADFERGNIRKALLDLYMKEFHLVKDLEIADAQLDLFPQHSLVVLTQLLSHTQYMLEALLYQEHISQEDLKTIQLSIEGMQYNFDEVETELRLALKKFEKKRFVVINSHNKEKK